MKFLIIGRCAAPVLRVLHVKLLPAYSAWINADPTWADRCRAIGNFIYSERFGMQFRRSAILIATLLAVSACASSGPRQQVETPPAASSAPAAGNSKIVKSRDGSFEGEIVGTPAPNSKFAKLKIGMDMNEVQEILGRAPDRLHTYESGKRWIPFYFGNDARRMQVLFKTEGCLIFTGGNIWGGSGGDLIQIEADTTGACYQP